MVSTAWNSASPASKSARCAVVRPSSGVVKFSARADMSACEWVRHCANSRTKTPVAAINTNIVFRTLSLSDFIVTPLLTKYFVCLFVPTGLCQTSPGILHHQTFLTSFQSLVLDCSSQHKPYSRNRYSGAIESNDTRILNPLRAQDRTSLAGHH